LIRNFINVVGITPENQLPKKNQGQIIQHAETEVIHIPDNYARIKSIHQVMIQVKPLSRHKINNPLGNIVILDGVKEFKIIYEEDSEKNQAIMINLAIPYNTFWELPAGVNDVLESSIYVVDAYFSLLDSSRIYSHIIYLIDIHYHPAEMIKPVPEKKLLKISPVLDPPKNS